MDIVTRDLVEIQVSLLEYYHGIILTIKLKLMNQYCLVFNVILFSFI